MFKQIPNCIELDEKVEVALMKYRKHPSIVAIKNKVRNSSFPMSTLGIL